MARIAGGCPPGPSDWDSLTDLGSALGSGIVTLPVISRVTLCVPSGLGFRHLVMGLADFLQAAKKSGKVSCCVGVDSLVASSLQVW